MPVWSGGRLEALAVWATAFNPFADQQDKEHHREEAKDVVEALQPHGRHDEVQLDEHGAEWQDAADDHRGEQIEVPCLVGHEPWQVCGGAVGSWERPEARCHGESEWYAWLRGMGGPPGKGAAVPSNAKAAPGLE